MVQNIKNNQYNHFESFYKNLKIMKYLILFCLLVSCIASDDHKGYIQKCANIKTGPHWEKMRKAYEEKVVTSKALLKQSKKKTTKANIKILKYNVRENKYYARLYKKAQKVSLKRKLDIFPQFKKNYNTCEDLYFEDTLSFKIIYK
jgi:hypothetical protein